MNLEELLSECTFERVTPTLLEQCEPFACGHDDLDEFFRSDYKLYADKLLGKTYAFRLIDNPSKIVSIFTLSNDAIRIKQLVAEDKEQIEYVTENGEKNLRRFPGVLIGRLWTNQTLSRKGYGTAVMDFIKAWFRSNENKTGCRFIIVDAHNNPDTIRYYEKNGFQFLYSEEINEAKSMGLNIKRPNTLPLNTRLMYFDLIKIGLD